MATKNGLRQSLRWIKQASLKCGSRCSFTFIHSGPFDSMSVSQFYIVCVEEDRPPPPPIPQSLHLVRIQDTTKYKQQKHTDKVNQLEVQLVYRVQSHFPKYMIYVYHEGQRGAASARYFVAGSNGSGLMFIWQLIFLNFFLYTIVMWWWWTREIHTVNMIFFFFFYSVGSGADGIDAARYTQCLAKG